MIPAAFEYVRPSSLSEAIAALRSGGDGVKVLAGGQIVDDDVGAVRIVPTSRDFPPKFFP